MSGRLQEVPQSGGELSGLLDQAGVVAGQFQPGRAELTGHRGR
jgi:hypothetical protein